MRSTSSEWNSIVADGEFHMQSVALVYGAAGGDSSGSSGAGYKQYATITKPIISRNLIPDNSISIGNCISSTLKFAILTTDTIPKSAKIVIKGRPVKDNDYGEWLEFGTFFISKRSKNDNLTEIEAYDSMKKGNQVYNDDSQTLSWPKTITTVVIRIAQQIGVEIDSRTTSYLSTTGIGDLNIITQPNEDWVLLDILKYIGEIIGGNWTITPENKLRLVPLISADAIGDTVNVPVVIGSLTTAMSQTISKVTMWADKENVFTYGDDTGFELRVENNPYATNSLCQSLYSRVHGLVYAPFVMTNCVYNPAAELGDIVIADTKVRSVLYNETATYDIGFSADISAPGDDEIEDEYPFQSAIKRLQYDATATAIMGEVRSEIRQSENEILAIVNATYVQGGVYNTTMTNADIWYLASASNYNVTTETVGWSRTLPTIDATNKFLWVYRVFRYGDNSVRETTPVIIANYDINGVVTSVLPIYYCSNIAIPLPVKPAQHVADTDATPLHWTQAIAPTSDDYPFMHYSYEVNSGEGLYWTDALTDSYTYVQLSGYVRESKASINEMGITLESVEENLDEINAVIDTVPSANTIRSIFALDPHSITLSAGVDQQGHPTGVITFNAGALVINSDYFTLNENGASLNGTLQTNVRYNDEIYTVEHKENGVTFSKGGSVKGYLQMQTTDYEEELDTGHSYTYPILELCNGSGTGIHIGRAGEYDTGILISPSGGVRTQGHTGITSNITIRGVTLAVHNGIITGVTY